MLCSSSAIILVIVSWTWSHPWSYTKSPKTDSVQMQSYTYWIRRRAQLWLHEVQYTADLNSIYCLPEPPSLFLQSCIFFSHLPPYTIAWEYAIYRTLPLLNFLRLQSGHFCCLDESLWKIARPSSIPATPLNLMLLANFLRLIFHYFFFR